MAKDTQSRKWITTINNPQNHGYSHDKIKEILGLFTGITYWCMCDEIGGKSQTHHTHLFFYSSSGIRFSTIKSRLDKFDIEMAKGTCEQNRDYIRKEGKYENDKKKDTNLIDTFEEWGEMPLERQGFRNDYADLFDDLKSGLSDLAIVEENPQHMFRAKDFDNIRNMIRRQEFSNKYRHMEVTYIYGSSGVGKTRYVYEKYGYANVFCLGDYYKHPFDFYNGQDVVLFDEYRSQFDFSAFLKYLDGQPIVLPCRYGDKQACYTKIFIVSNVPLLSQYVDVMKTDRKSYNALLRRINYVVELKKDSELKLEPARDYLMKNYYKHYMGDDLPF